MVAESRHYVDKKILYRNLVEYHQKRNDAIKAGTPRPRIPEYIGYCLLLVCRKLGTRWNFSDYSYNEEMVHDAVENCVLAVDKFDPRKSENPYGYFSIIAWNAMVRRIQREKKQQYIKHMNLENMYVTFDDLADDGELVSWSDMGGQGQSLSGGAPGSSSQSASSGMINHYRVIEQFETSLKKRGVVPDGGKALAPISRMRKGKMKIAAKTTKVKPKKTNVRRGRPCRTSPV